MKGYIEQHLWSELEVTKPLILWVSATLLRIPEELIKEHRRNLPSLIYRVYFSLSGSDNKYVQNYNAARADVIADLIPPVDEDKRIISIASEPEGDISYWICSHVLGFNDNEIAILCNVSISCLDNPGRDLIPLVKSSHGLLRKIKLQDPLMHHYHRMRYLMIGYFLDAVYHEI